MITKIINGEEIRMDPGVVIGPEMINLPDYPYVYLWKRVIGREGQFCRVIAWEGRNVARIEFEDGSRAITSRNALRKKGNRAQE